MNIKKMKEFLDVFPQYDIAFEDLSNLKITIKRENNDNLNLKTMMEILESYNDIWNLDIVKDSNGRKNDTLKQKLISNSLKDHQFNQISEFDFVLDKDSLSLGTNQYYIRDVSVLTSLTPENLPNISVLYNHTFDIDSVIRFVNIENDEGLSENYRYDNNSLEDDEYRYRNLLEINSNNEDFDNWKNFIAIGTLVNFITNQKNNIIILEGHKKVKLKLEFNTNYAITENELLVFNRINKEFNNNNLNSIEKKNLLIKVMTIYLNDDSNIPELISKIDKIYETFKQLYSNFLDNELDSFFDKKNKIIDEIIKTSTKINDEINKMFTQIFSVLITLLATQFIYYVRSESLSDESKITFDIIFLSFLAIYLLIFFFSNKSTIKYYTNFISSYFDVVGSVYQLNHSESKLRKEFMDPSIKRYKKSFWSTFGLLIAIIIIYIFVKFNILGLLLPAIKIISNYTV